MFGTPSNKVYGLEHFIQIGNDSIGTFCINFMPANLVTFHQKRMVVVLRRFFNGQDGSPIAVSIG